MAMTGAERQAKWRRTNPNQRAKRQLAEEKRQHWLRMSPEERNRHGLELGRRRRRKIKQEALTYYGDGLCVCVACEENRLECLSIDHIDGGGSKQRRRTTLRSSNSFYRWLKRNQFPEGYQTLCMNCQFIKRFNREEHT